MIYSNPDDLLPIQFNSKAGHQIYRFQKILIATLAVPLSKAAKYAVCDFSLQPPSGFKCMFCRGLSWIYSSVKVEMAICSHIAPVPEIYSTNQLNLMEHAYKTHAHKC